jgi:hypothetical protein
MNRGRADLVQLDPVEHIVAVGDEVVGGVGDAFREHVDADVAGRVVDKVRDDLGLVPADRVDGRAVTVGVGRLERVGIGELEVSYSHADEPVGAGAAEPVASGDADDGVAQSVLTLALLLFGVAQPAEVAADSLPVEVVVVLGCVASVLGHAFVLPRDDTCSAKGPRTASRPVRIIGGADFG